MALKDEGKCKVSQIICETFHLPSSFNAIG